LAGAQPAFGQDEPQPPAAPGGLHVSTEIGSLDVDVDWDDVDDATRYVVRWRTAEPGGKLNKGEEVSVSRAEITVAGTGAWVVRVQACNDAGCGTPSAEKFEVEPAPEPESTPEPESEPEPVADTENAQAQTELTVSVRASATAPFAGEQVRFSADIDGAPEGEQPTYQWELSYGGDLWFPSGSDPTFSYLPHQPETASVRVSVRYASGVSARSAPLSVTWRVFEPKPQPPTAEGARGAVEQVSVTIRHDETVPRPFQPGKLVALVSNLPDGEQPRYRWEMNLGGDWWVVGSERAFPWSATLKETVRFRVTVFIGSDQAVTSDELALDGTAGKATRDVNAAATSVALIGNSGQTSFGNPQLTSDRAQAFTTGSHSTGYKLTSVQIDFKTNAGAAYASDVKIMNDGGAGPGSTTLGTLTDPASLVAGLNEFTGDVDLAASTTYYVVIDSSVADFDTILDGTSSNDEDSGGAAGWSIGDDGHSRGATSTGAWSSNANSLKIIVNGYEKQAPSVSNTGQTSVASRSLANNLAQAFTTGDHAKGYTLTALGWRLSSVGTAEPSHTVKICPQSGTEPSTSCLGTLENPLSLTVGTNRFTAAGGGIRLDANTTYFMVHELVTAGTGSYAAARTNSDDEDSGAASGWSIGNDFLVDVSGTWHPLTSPLQIYIESDPNIAPAVASAEIDGTKLVLTFDADLDTASGTAAGAFTIKADGTAQTATAITIADRTVTLTVPTVTPGQTVTVSYTKPASSPLKGADDSEVDGFTDQAVTNNTLSIRLVQNTSQADTVNGPLDDDRAQSFTTGSKSLGYRLTSVQLGVDVAGSPSYTATIVRDTGAGPGNLAVATLAKPSSLTVGYENEFTGEVDLLPSTTYFFKVDMSASALAVELKLALVNGEVGEPGWSIGNDHHERLWSSNGAWSAVFQSLKIQVNGYAKAPALDKAEIDGAELVLTYDGNLDTASATAPGAFTISVGGGAAQAATAITIAGKTVTLTVPAVTDQQTVTVTYTKPDDNPLKGSNAEAVAGFTDRPVTNNPSITARALIGNGLQPGAAGLFLDGDRAQAFTTGPNSDGYKLTSIQLGFGTAGSPTDYAVKIMNDGGSGPGTTKLAELVGPTSLTVGLNEFKASGTGIDLAANTTYYILVDLGASDSTFTHTTTTSKSEDTGGANGWSIANSYYKRNVNNSGSWTEFITRILKFVVNGHPKLPATSALIGNNSQGDNSEFGFDADRAQPFTTGTNSTGYRLKNVQLGVKTAGSPTNYKVKVMSDSGSGPGAELATLENPSSLTVGLNSFTGDVDLTPNTTYYIVVDQTDISTAKWKRTASDDEDSGGAAGWSMGDRFWTRSYGSAGAWREAVTSDILKVVVNGYAKPTSSTATADAGEDQTVQTGDPVTLDGSGSATTKAGATLTYTWTQTSGPAVTLSDATAARPTFTAPTYRADYVFSLVVDDGDGISMADTVMVAVRPPINPATAPCQSPDEGAAVDATVISTPTTTAAAVTWGATTTGGAGTADLYFCSPDGTRELVGSAIAAGTTRTKSGLESGTKYWVGALKTTTSDGSVSWSGWTAATTTGSASIVAVQIASTPRWDADEDGEPETYGRGDTIQIDVTYSQDVTVTGALDKVRVRLDVGTDDSDLSNSQEVAKAASHSGTRLRFEYTVKTNDVDSDGVWVQTQNAMSDKIIFLAGGATLKNGANNAKLTKSGLPTSGDPKHKVDHQHFATVPAFPNATETLTIDENSAEGVTVGTVTATDADGDTLYYSLDTTTGDHARFTVGQTGADAGTIKVGPGQNFDFETPPNSYTVTVNVTDRKDSDGNAETPPYTIDDTVVVTINVINVEEPPDAPTVTAVTGASTTSVTVTWTAPSDTGAKAITDYDLRYYEGSAEPTDAADWVEEGETNGHTHTGTATTATITGLAEDTTYQVQVRAEGDGEGAWSTTGSGATLTPPAAPRGLWAQASTTFLILQWSNPGDSTIIRYQTRHSTDGGTTWTGWTNLHGSNASTVWTNLSNLTSGTYYDVELRTVHSIGGSWSASTGGTPSTSGILGPSNLRATAADGQVTLRWTRNSSATRQRVRQRVAGGSWSDTLLGGGAGTHTATGLTNGTTYRFEVQTGQTNSWDKSSTIDVTPTARAVAPGNFTALPGDRSISLSWDNPGDAGITAYQIRVSDDGGATWDPDWADITGSDANTTMHSLSSLTNGTTYTIEVRASRGMIHGAVSSATATPNLPPPAPSGLSSTAGDGLVDLSWTDPGDSSITKYQTRHKAGSGAFNAWADIASSGATTTSHRVTGLTNDTSYTIEVRAVRSGPLYGASSSTTAIPRPTVPAAPASFTATPGDGRVDLAWTDPSNSQITAYQYRYKAGTGSWNPNWTDISGSGATTTMYTVMGLTNDTTYTFEVRAKAGTTIVSDASSATATPRPTAPPAPASFAATAGDGRVTLNWTDPSDTQISRYRYRQSTDGGMNWSSWMVISGSGAATTMHTVTSLTNDTDYSFELQARRGTATWGASGSATATPRPAAPSAPANLSADVGDKQITLRWNNPNDNRITEYRYRQSTDDGVNWSNWTDMGAGAATVSYTVTSLTNDQEYKFEVEARRGTQTYGSASSVTQTPRPPAPPAPAGLTADPGNTTVTLDWTDPSDTLISVYQYRQSTDGGATWNPDWGDISGSDKDTITHALTGLTNDTTYTFEVRSRRGTATTGPASRVTVTPKAPPPAPRGLWARGLDGEVELRWSNPGDSTITKYQLRQSTDDGATWNPDWTDIPDSGANTTMRDVVSLTNTTYYDFELRAVRGTSNAGTSAAIGVEPSNSGLSGPNNLRATASDTQVTLAWDQATLATRYRVRHRASTTTTWESWTTISSGTTTTHTQTGLTNGTTYRFEVQTGQSGSWDRRSAVEATPTERAAAPLNFTALPGNRTIMLSWTDPNDSNITKYEYRYKAGSGNWNPDWTVITGAGATTTMHTLSNLTNGTTYTVELRASRGTVVGAVSSTTATPNLPPGRPSGLSATPGDTKVDLSWTNPSDSSIVNYQYRVSDDSGMTWSPDWTDTGTATTTTLSVTGLKNDTTYTIELRAARSGRLYGPAASRTATPRPTPPLAPTSFTATAGDREVELAWADPSDTLITKYQYRQKVGTGNWANWTDISGAATTMHTVTGLTNDTTYSFQVRARRGTVTHGPASSSASATPRPTAPPAPSGLTATAGDGKVDLSWTDPSDSLISKYRYRVSDDGGMTWGNWTVISTSSAATTMHTVTGLTNDTPYSFELQARRGTVTVGPAASATATPRPAAPPAPTNLRAEVGDGQITLRWNNPNDSRISVYSHREKEVGGNWSPNWTDIPMSNANTTSFVSTGLTNDDTYHFEVRARRGTVTYGAESSVTGTPRPDPPPAPKGLSADPGNAQVTLNWTDPMDPDIRVYEIRQKAGNAAWTAWADISGSDKDTITHIVSSLDNDTRYRFEIRAVRGAVTSGDAAGVTVTPKAPPPAPRNLRATPAAGQIVVDWTNPNDSTITKYEFRQSTDGGTNWNPDWGAISGSGSATTSLTRTGLTDGTYHDIEVRAVRGSANAGTAAAIGAEPLSTGPAAPAALRATAADGQVTLSWSEGGSTVDRYRVRNRPSGGSWSGWTVKSGRTTTTHTEMGLTNGTAVRFEVAAGTSAPAFGPASSIEATPTERPAAPVNLVPYARPAYVYLTWDDPNDPLITEYQFRRSTDGGSTWSPNWTKVAGSGATTTWFNLATLLNGTTYTIEVRAVRGARLGVAGRVTATPRTPPSTPAGFTATSGDNEVVLGWTNPGDASISKYQSRHQADGETNWTDWTDIDGNSAAHTVTGLTNDTTYTFQLRAVRDRDNGGLAASATATPKPPPPAAVTGLMPTTGATPRDGGIALSWTNPGDTRISRYEYRVQRDGQSAWRPDWTEVPGSSDSTASYIVTGLLNDTTYTVEVRAVRGADTAGDADSVTIKTPKPAPRGLIARADNGQVHLSWTDPGDDEITTYQIRQSTNDGSTWTTWADITGSDKDTVAHTVSGLANGTAVTFEIRAHVLGTPPQEGVAAQIESMPIDTSSVPAAPEEARATAGNSQVTLIWANPQDETITKYQFRHRLIAGTLEGAIGNAENWDDIPDSDANTTSYTVTELENGNVYQFDVRAVYDTADFGAVTSMIATPKRPVSQSSSGGGGGGGGGGGARAQPSEEEFDWNVTRDIEALDGENDFPTGLWSDGVMLWVVENATSGPDRVFAYALEDGARQADLEFEFERRNRFAHGIWSDGEVVWIADAGQDKLFAYRLDSGERLEERDYTLNERNRDPRGIWSDGEVIYVLDSGKDALFAYDVQSGELDAEYPLDRLNRSPRGIWSDGVTIWVSDDGAKRLLAYRIVEVEVEGEERSQVLQRHEAEEFTFRSLLSSGNSDPRGIWSDGDVMYVADDRDDRVYSYNMPDAIDARLASLSLGDFDLAEFSPRQLSYQVSIEGDITQTTVVAAPVYEAATVEIAPGDADGDPENGHQVAIEDGLAINVTVTSEDDDRTQVYTVVFERANRAPLGSEIPALELTAKGDPVEFSLSDYFSDPDGDPLSYTLGEPTDASVVSLVESDGVLSVTPLEAGATSFALSASDGELRSEPVEVEISVEAVPVVAQAPEVRIGARRVVNGRVEFGLGVRAADGAWQPLILPPRRFLPADAELDRWLVSTPIEVGPDDAPRTLRIAARQLASGSVEFALLVRLEGGGWSARLLPFARFLHSDAALDHWLYSTPLSSAEPR